MANGLPLSLTEKERIYRGKLTGRTLAELAAELTCSIHCTRKWWRVARDHGLNALRAPRRTRSKTGTLSQFDPRIAEAALALKQTHRRWGPIRVLAEMASLPALHGLPLPGKSRLAVFFKQSCPDCVGAHKPRGERPPRPPQAHAVHEVWQLDNQEGIRLNNGDIATLCNIRDPVGAAMIASQAFSVKTRRHWRKLDWTETRGVLRTGFTEWGTLPDSLLTDNELGLAGSPQDRFPGKLTLWLVGLGIAHRFIRPGCPTDQPHIERNHRTLDNLALDEQAITDLDHLQAALDRERPMHNGHLPSRASDCNGRPPLGAHPELLAPRRPYRPELELALFDIQRVYTYLASFTFKRTVNAAAQVSLGNQPYYLGQRLVRERSLKTVLARFDSAQREWIFLTEEEEELLRRAPKSLDVRTLTGLDPSVDQAAQPLQLSFPFFIA
jgi:transposase InsO family protein